MIYEPVFPSTRTATSICQSIVNSLELEPLERNCPGLKFFDYTNYLECSIVRIDKVLAFLRSVAPIMGNRPILDCGSWLGNFSLALQFEGWNVLSTEFWNKYAPALDRQKQMLVDRSIDVMDMMMLTGRVPGPTYSAILWMSCIEHIPDSPKRLLKILYDSLMPGGFLILDTPNLVTIGNRRRFSRGLSCYPEIREQFITEAPFAGHNREYTAGELSWMLETTGFKILTTEFFDYSNIPFLKSPLAKIQTFFDETKKELIFMAAQKPRENETQG